MEWSVYERLYDFGFWWVWLGPSWFYWIVKGGYAMWRLYDYMIHMIIWLYGMNWRVLKGDYKKITYYALSGPYRNSAFMVCHVIKINQSERYFFFRLLKGDYKVWRLYGKNWRVSERIIWYARETIWYGRTNQKRSHVMLCRVLTGTRLL